MDVAAGRQSRFSRAGRDAKCRRARRYPRARATDSAWRRHYRSGSALHVDAHCRRSWRQIRFGRVPGGRRCITKSQRVLPFRQAGSRDRIDVARSIRDSAAPRARGGTARGSDTRSGSDRNSRARCLSSNLWRQFGRLLSQNDRCPGCRNLPARHRSVRQTR